MSVHVKIEQNAIDNAIKKESRHCMIADAIHAQMPHVKFIQVDIQSIRFTNPKTGKRYIYLTPPEAQKQILRFDAGQKIAPFSISLNDHFVRTVGIPENGGSKTKATSKSKSKLSPKIQGTPETQATQLALERWLDSFKSSTEALETAGTPRKAKAKRKSNWRHTKTLPASQREFGLRKLVGKKIEMHSA